MTLYDLQLTLKPGDSVTVNPLATRRTLTGKVYSVKRLGAFVEYSNDYHNPEREFFLAGELTRIQTEKDTTT